MAPWFGFMGCGTAAEGATTVGPVWPSEVGAAEPAVEGTEAALLDSATPVGAEPDEPGVAVAGALAVVDT